MDGSVPKLMLLGGLRYLFPVIDAAHALGAQVITVDNVPRNPAHRRADLSFDVSVTDPDAVLNLAMRLGITGIMAFACDPGVVTASIVAEELALPAPAPAEAVRILQDKVRFRHFLRNCGVSVPQFSGFTDLPGAREAWRPLSAGSRVIVKPADSAGSKGVRIVADAAQLDEAAAGALRMSKSGRAIMERHIDGAYISDCDALVAGGKIRGMEFSDQMFDPTAANPNVPAAYSWPSTMPPAAQAALRRDIEKVFRKLGVTDPRFGGLYNIETRVSPDGTPYIMELSPRGGGNRLSEMQRLLTGSDFVAQAVACALGMDADIPDAPPLPLREGERLMEILLHPPRAGVFRRLSVDPALSPHVVEADLWVSPGDSVPPFRSAADAIGTLVLRLPRHISPSEASHMIEIIID